ncbi:MAG: DUF559 domain-containing protein [Candidatus Riflebacteria bacterium]|nr:DUF559 domain-containing protein [Candidatus Riflebacteria bacterium]
MKNNRVYKSLLNLFESNQIDTDGLDGDFRSIIGGDKLKTEFEDPEIQNSFQAAAASFLLLCWSRSSDLLKMAFQSCESPIEIHFISAFICAAAVNDIAIQVYNNHSQQLLTSSQESDFDGFIIKPQYELSGYRCDFLIEYASTEPDFERPVKTAGGLEIPGFKKLRTSVIVECDGHDFHEKTKHQAARDKKRDRNIQSTGFHILRFTGSEIWKSPVGCAQEVIEFLQATINKIA